MRKKKNKRFKNKKDTILLIVENSEKVFFTHYFSNVLKDKYNINIDCISSGSAGNCEITNGNKMSSRINFALDVDGYKAVFLMMDLKTKCLRSEQTYKCYVKLKKEYLPRYTVGNKDRFYLLVVCNEIESWFLTMNQKKHNTNNVYENHKKELMDLLNSTSESQIVQKMIINLRSEKYCLDFEKNISLKYFIDKLIAVTKK
jgi:hypothetical protein